MDAPQPPRLEIRLFGTPTFRFDGRAFALVAPPMTLPLLAYVIVRADRPPKRAQAAATLWPDCTESVARSNLRRHVHRLNRALPALPDAAAPWILADRGTLAWNPRAPASVDAIDFVRHSAAGEWEAAVACYSGPFLEGHYDDWVLLERERLRERQLEHLLKLTIDKRSERDISAAMRFAQLAAGIDPLHEGALRQLIAVRYEAGDRAGALLEYERFAERLATELGAEPMPETIALYDVIRRDGVLPAATANALEMRVAAAPDRHRFPFVGRASLLDDLVQSWRRAAGGAGSAALIFGEAGIGKSRLAWELSVRAEAEGARVLTGFTPPIEAVPYQSVRDALLDGLPIVLRSPVDAKWLTVLATLLPQLREHRPDIELAESLDAAYEQSRLFEAIVNAIGAIARVRPLVLVLEDQHWAGSASISLLEYVLNRVAGMRLMLVVTYRDDEVDRQHALHAVRRSSAFTGRVKAYGLSALTRDDVATIVREQAPDADPETIERFFIQSDGNPFFLREVLYELNETSSASAAAPDDVGTLLQRRIARLSAKARVLAEDAAVIGRGFNVELVREICGWPESEILTVLDELLDRHVIHESSARGRFDYTFSHHLLQSAIHDAIPAESLRRRHRRVAHVLADLYASEDDLAAEIARHCLSGGDGADAARHYLRAARHALGLCANSEAIAYASQAIDLAEDAKLTFDSTALREEVYKIVGDREAQFADLQRLEETARSLPDLAFACEASRRRCKFEHERGDHHAEAREWERLHRLAEREGSERFRAAADIVQAFVGLDFKRYGEAERAARNAVVRYRHAGFSFGEFVSLCLLARIELARGDSDRADAYVREARAVLPPNDLEMLCMLLEAAEEVAGVRGDLNAARNCAGELIASTQRLGDRAREAHAHAKLAGLMARAGESDAAREHYRTASTIYGEVGDMQGAAAVADRLARLDDSWTPGRSG